MKFISSVEELGMEKGMEKGRLAKVKESIVDVLTVRFARVPDTIQKALAAIEDRRVLKELHRKAVFTASMEQFESEFQGFVRG